MLCQLLEFQSKIRQVPSNQDNILYIEVKLAQHDDDISVEMPSHCAGVVLQIYRGLYPTLGNSTKPLIQEAVFRVVAAILSLGNIAFGSGADEESSVVLPGQPSEYLRITAELLGVDKDGLVKALTTRTRQTPDGPIVSPLDVKAALENRDSLAKILYSKASIHSLSWRHLLSNSKS
jgi:hypothetical protein